MKNKIMTAAEAAMLVHDNATVAITGSGGGLLEADEIFTAVEARFLESGSPRALTLVHALGIGDRKARGHNRFAHEGMVRRDIGGHYGWSPRMQALGHDNKIEAYSLPGGVITHLLREIGAGRPGLFTHVGLGTFVDPRIKGGRMNDAAKDEIVDVLNINGREYLHYKPFQVDVGIIRGTYADKSGNIAMTGEPADLDTYAIALAAHNCGGKVLAQVREIVPDGALPPRSVRIPGVLVNAIVAVPDQMQTYRGLHDGSISGEMRTARDLVAGKGQDDQLKRIIAKRAMLELRPGLSLNFGFGAPALIAGLITEAGDQNKYWFSVEQGIHNGHLIDGDLFGMAHNPAAIIASPDQFDFYSGGGIDMTFLGMAEMDGEGNVNVHSLNGVINGPGGFLEISQNAKTVVFCGTFDAKGSELTVNNDKLEVRRQGKIRKLVDHVSQITFSGKQARKNGQTVLYVTERATFRLAESGVELVDVAPGIDLRRDVLDQMGFAPEVGNIGSYPTSVLR